MKTKFYSFRFIVLLIIAGSFSQTAIAQNVYFREGFAPTDTWPTAASDVYPGTTPLTGGVYIQTDNGLVWYSRGVFRSNGPTGSCTTQTGDPAHGRWGNLNTLSGSNAADSAFLVTPVVDFGINTLTYYNGRASRRFSIYKTTDTLASTEAWTFVAHYSTTNAACDFFSTSVNDPAARRLKIVSRSGTDSDLDSLVMTSTSPIVPVKFTGINAASVNGFTKVTWNIATELNTRSYVVEKSTDGANFLKVAEVAATNAGSYSWIDNAASTGVAYYRVKAIDKDGKLDFSGIVKIAANQIKAEFLITPNMISGRTMNLQLNNITKGTLGVRVTNNMGQVVYTTSIVNEGGAVSKTVQLPATLNAGTYRVQVMAGATLLTQTAILQ